MTKRFKNVKCEIWQNGEWWCSANGEHCADVIATALNEQLETITRLEAQLSHLEYRFTEYRNKQKSITKEEVKEILQKHYNQELGLYTHSVLEKIAEELGVDLE